MTIRLLRYETPRYAAAGKGPLVVLLALSVARPMADRLLASPPGAQSTVASAAPAAAGVTELVVTLWSVAVVAGFAWLVVAIVRAARQPARDAEAAEHVQSLRDRAIIEGRDLVEIHHTRWATQAGQQAFVVNVFTGGDGEVWLPEARLRDGSFALLARDGERTAIAAWASREQVTATSRHRRRALLRTPARRRLCLIKEVGAVVAEAEALARGKE